MFNTILNTVRFTGQVFNIVNLGRNYGRFQGYLEDHAAFEQYLSDIESIKSLSEIVVPIKTNDGSFIVDPSDQLLISTTLVSIIDCGFHRIYLYLKDMQGDKVAQYYFDDHIRTLSNIRQKFEDIQGVVQWDDDKSAIIYDLLGIYIDTAQDLVRGTKPETNLN